jgi:hypothetical protein
MKKLFMIAIALITFQCVQAQTRIGVKAGVNFATFEGDDVDNAEMYTAFHGGLFANIPISEMLSVQPEAFYSGQGAKYTVLGAEVTSKLNYINIPVMLQFNASGFYAEIGPQLGVLLSSSIDGGGISFDTDNAYKTTDIGAGIGLGFKLDSGFGAGVRYTMGLTSIDDIGDGDVKNAVISLGVQYAFGGE